MPDDRLARMRDAYRCERAYILVARPHCPCRGCALARDDARRYRELAAAVQRDERCVDGHLGGVGE